MIVRVSKQLFLLVIFTALLISQLSAQSEITFYNQFSVDNYLKDREVRKIDRDEAGSFWLLETSVIQKFDGRYVTENIPHPVVNPKYFSCLSDNSIILISQEAQVYRIDKESSQVLELNTSVLDCPTCKIVDINLINEVLYLYYLLEESFVVYKASIDDQYKSLNKITDLPFSSPEIVQSIYKVGEDYLLSASQDRLFRVQAGQEVELPLVRTSGRTEGSIQSNYVGEKDLFFSLPGRWGTYRYQNGVFSTIQQDKLLSFAKKDKKGKILLGLSETYNHSEYLYILEDDSLRHWKEITEINETYTDAYVEDVNEKILLGSHVGLFFVKIRTDGLLATHQSITQPNGFGNVVLSLAQVPNGEIYYVKENKGIYKYHGADGPERLKLSDQLINNQNCIYDGLDGKLWISGYTDRRNGVLFSYDIQTEELDRHDFRLPVMYFKRLEKDKLILSTSVQLKSTILLYNTQTKTIIDTLLSLENERARRFEYFANRGLLVGTTKRLLLYDLANKTIETILPETIVQSIVPLRQGFAICTRGKGVIFLDNDLKILSVADESKGLTNNHVYSVLETDNENYWVGTGNGLNVVDSNYQFVRSFDMNDGTSSHEFNTNASLELSNGNLLFGTINGVTEVNPDLALGASQSEVLSIPSISYLKDGEKITQVIKGEEVQLPSDASLITLKVLSNDFYKYTNINKPIGVKVETEPESLVYSTKENEILIPFLESTATTLTILSPNALNSGQIITIVLIKKKDRSAIYWVAGALLLASVISFLVTSKIIRFNKKRYNERRKNEVKMAELELQALRSQMNPHFIFNSLGAILLYLQTNEKKKAEKYLTKFAKLMRMFLESSKSKFISFVKEQNLLELYLELEKLRFEDKFKYKFEIDSRIDTYSFTIPSMLLQPFVENSVNHGLYHKKVEAGVLLIKAIPNGENVKIIIKDNGIGRRKAAEIRKNSLKKHRSRATEIIQERLSVLKKEKNIDIDIEYNDLLDAEGEAAGTEVVITVPKMLKHND